MTERTAELTIINSIGEAMARQLDVDTIVKIVGDKVREIFQAEVVTILLYDAGAGMIQEAYAYDRGDVTVATTLSARPGPDVDHHPVAAAAGVWQL